MKTAIALTFAALASPALAGPCQDLADIRDALVERSAEAIELSAQAGIRVQAARTEIESAGLDMAGNEITRSIQLQNEQLEAVTEIIRNSSCVSG